MKFICPVCACEEYKDIYSQNIVHPLWWKDKQYKNVSLSYVICLDCGFITQYPALDFEILSEYYKSSPTPSKESFRARAHLFEERKRFLTEHIENPVYGRVIEVGAAYGDFLSLLTEFEERIAIEPSESYNQRNDEVSSDIIYIPVLLEELDEKEPELKQSGDLVVAAHVLEHTANPAAFVKHLRDLVKDGGYLFIEVPSIEGFAECITPIFQNLFFGHLHHFSLEVLNRLCVSQSLIPVFSSYSIKDNYPIIRALFRKTNIIKTNTELFIRHIKNVSEEYETAIELLTKAAEKSTLKILVWGIGDDFIRILNSLSDMQRGNLISKTIFADMNLQKQGRVLFGKEIHAPYKVSVNDFECVVVPIKSEILVFNIIKDIEEIYPGKRIIPLFQKKGK